jgi:hypothetical protein
VADFCEHGNEPSCSITGGEFLERLSYYQFFKQDSPPRSQYRLDQYFSTASPRQIFTGPENYCQWSFLS